MNADPLSVWSGLIGTRVIPAVSNTGGAPVRKVRDGVLVSPPLSREDGHRKKLYLLFIGQLNAALCERARTAERLHEEMEIPLSLQALVCEFHKDVIQAVQKTLGRRRSGAPTTLADARKIVSKVRDFELKLDLELTHDHIRAFDLAVCMRDLCDDVRHYIRQIELTAVHHGPAQRSPAASRTIAPNSRSQCRNHALKELHQPVGCPRQVPSAT